MSSSALAPALRVLADDSGTFAMLALDQRESLRQMMAQSRLNPALPDAELVAFKSTASEILSPGATAILVDRLYGLPAAVVARCPVILAADELIQGRDGPVTCSNLDHEVTAQLIESVEAVALKMLIMWTPESRERAVDLAHEFMALCRTLGLPGIVEGVVRPADISRWDDARRNDAIALAAQDLSQSRPDLYKAEVPSYGRADFGVLLRASESISAALDCPWVVLSSGVAPHDFSGAVQACCSGGASGFLAGRAVWSDALGAPDTEKFLRTESVARLDTLRLAARSRS